MRHENYNDNAKNWGMETDRYAMSRHFLIRQGQRGIGKEMVALALRYGRRFYEGNEQVYFLGRKQMPHFLDPRLMDRANGTVVVVGSDNTLVTAYRNPLYVRALKRRTRPYQSYRACRTNHDDEGSEGVTKNACGFNRGVADAVRSSETSFGMAHAAGMGRSASERDTRGAEE